MSNIVELDPKQRARRSLTYFLDHCTVEERMQLLKELENRCWQEGFRAGLDRAEQILDKIGVFK